MNQLITALIILGLAGWFVFSLRKVIQGAAGCARCGISSLRRHKKGAAAYATLMGIRLFWTGERHRRDGNLSGRQ